MDLLWIRRKFAERSGRADLVKDGLEGNDTDNGADFYINAACRDLDLEQDTEYTMAQHQFTLAIDAYEIDVLNSRSINKVYYTSTDNAQVELKIKSYEWMRKTYPKLGSTDSGSPTYWAVQSKRRSPEQKGGGPHPENMSILILPPTNASTAVTIFGRFWSDKLKENGDENYWSVNFPELLVLATCRNAEGWYRNTQGYNDYDRLVQKALLGIDKDLAEQEMMGKSGMRG